MSRYFDRGIQVPIVIFADPTGREIQGTRLDHEQAQVKKTYLEHARKALESFRGGQSAEKAKEAWTALGSAMRLRAESEDPGAAVEEMVALRDAAAKGSALRDSLEEMLRRIDEEEGAGMLEVAKMDLGEEDDPSGIEELLSVVRDFPGLPTAKRAEELLSGIRAGGKHPGELERLEKEHRARLALRAADRLSRKGKGKEAVEAWKKVAKEFEGTEAGKAAAERKADGEKKEPAPTPR